MSRGVYYLFLGACRRETVGENIGRKINKKRLESLKNDSKFTSDEIFPAIFNTKNVLSDSLLALN